MAKFTWQDGTLVSKAKVEIGGTIYEVDPEEYSGATPLSASNLNAMQDGIYEDIDEAKEKIENMSIYSTQEKVIGKWTDERPMYRKIISIKNLSGVTSYVINNLTSYCPDFDIDAFLIINAQYKRSGYQQWWNIPERIINAQSTNGTIELNNFNNYGATEIRLIVEYAKTTD